MGMNIAYMLEGFIVPNFVVCLLSYEFRFIGATHLPESNKVTPLEPGQSYNYLNFVNFHKINIQSHKQISMRHCNEAILYDFASIHLLDILQSQSLRKKYGNTFYRHHYIPRFFVIFFCIYSSPWTFPSLGLVGDNLIEFAGTPQFYRFIFLT